MALPDWVLKFKEPKTEIKFIKGVYYKYAVEYRYNPEKKRTDKITRELLGKITEKDGFVPSSKNTIRIEHQYRPTVVDIKTYGVYNLFSSLLGEDCNSLQALFAGKTGEALLTVAMMRFAYQHPIKRMPYQHAHDYCSLFWAKEGLDDKAISLALRHIGENRQLIIDWMKKRLGVKAGQEHFVMIDSTHIPTLSENLHVNAVGYNAQRNYDPQVRLMYIFSALMNQPVYYRLINGNITDVASMKTCIDELNAKSVVFIADKGFYSKKNVAGLKANDMYFIVPLHRNNKLIDYEPLKKANYKREIKTTLFIKRG